jgi:hypothetical protein
VIKGKGKGKGKRKGKRKVHETRKRAASADWCQESRPIRTIGSRLGRLRPRRVGDEIGLLLQVGRVALTCADPERHRKRSRSHGLASRASRSDYKQAVHRFSSPAGV